MICICKDAGVGDNHGLVFTIARNHRVASRNVTRHSEQGLLAGKSLGFCSVRLPRG